MKTPPKQTKQFLPSAKKKKGPGGHHLKILDRLISGSKMVSDQMLISD
jgi:hypothetical protein